MFLNVLRDGWQHIDGVLDLVNGRVANVLSVNAVVLFFGEARFVVELHVVVRVIVGPDQSLVVGVDAGPVIEVEWDLEDHAFVTDKLVDFDAFLHDGRQVVPEQVRCNVRVLVLTDVVNHQVDGFNLVVLERIVNRSVVVVSFPVIFLGRLGLINDGVEWIVVLLVVVIQQVLHRTTIEC